MLQILISYSREGRKERKSSGLVLGKVLTPRLRNRTKALVYKVLQNLCFNKVIFLFFSIIGRLMSCHGL